ncbi:Sodium/nucleoside cotransporter 1 [Lamellibrachia satsuma]|nr:Sodium/nucleoside cotransporter 1 [Lamellibrachia satsuma]
MTARSLLRHDIRPIASLLSVGDDRSQPPPSRHPAHCVTSLCWGWPLGASSVTTSCPLRHFSLLRMAARSLLLCHCDCPPSVYQRIGVPPHLLPLKGPGVPVHILPVKGPGVPIHFLPLKGPGVPVHILSLKGPGVPVHILPLKGPGVPVHILPLKGPGVPVHILPLKGPGIRQLWKTDDSRISYTKLRDRYCRTLASTKAAFYSKEIESASNDNRAMFRIANHLLGRKCMNLLPSDTIGPDAVADRFAYYFADKITSIRSQIQCSSANVDNAQPCTVSSPLLAFQPASLEEVTTLIENGKTKSSMTDPLPIAILKANTSILAPILRNVINLSYGSSTVPARLKHAVVTPLLKRSGLPVDDYASYRPISNLPYVSKILERHVFAQLRLHMQHNNIGDPFQSAYRPSHSVETAITESAYEVTHFAGSSPTSPTEHNVSMLMVIYLATSNCDMEFHRAVSRLDFGNAALYGIAGTLLHRLEKVQRSAARVVLCLRRRDQNSLTAALRELHWLPVAQRIQFKLLTLMHGAVHANTPRYLADRISPYVPCRSLRSADQSLIVVPRSAAGDTLTGPDSREGELTALMTSDATVVALGTRVSEQSRSPGVCRSALIGVVCNLSVATGVVLVVRIGSPLSTPLITCGLALVLILVSVILLFTTWRWWKSREHGDVKTNPGDGNWHASWSVLLVLTAAVLVSLSDYVTSDVRCHSFAGLVALLMFEVAFSANRRAVNWKLVAGGILLHLVVGAILLGWRPAFDVIARAMQIVSAQVRYILLPGVVDANLKMLLLNTAWGTVVLLLFVNIPLYMTSLVFRRAFGGSATDALIFVGAATSSSLQVALTLKRYLAVMTLSELHVLMTVTMITSHGSLLPLFIAFKFPVEYVIIFNIMCAPAAFGVTKLSYPPALQSRSWNELDLALADQELSDEALVDDEEKNGGDLVNEKNCVIKSRCVRSRDCESSCNTVVALLLGLAATQCFLTAAAFALANYTVKNILSHIFKPLVVGMGIEDQYVRQVAALLGTKLLAISTRCYDEIREALTFDRIDQRGAVISFVACSGAANLFSLVFISTLLVSLRITRKGTLLRLVGRAFIDTNAVVLLAACTTGLFYSGSPFSFPLGDH